MRTTFAALLLLPLTGCAGGMAARQASAERAIESILADYANELGPGASVLVRKDGQVLAARGMGLARISSGERADALTNYRLASVTKQFTAMAILILSEQGALGLDDPIGRWLPKLPAWGDRITIRHLLTHTSGIADYEDLIPGNATRQVLDRDVLHLVREAETTSFEPGSSYAYSNTGYALLALIVENASGETFPAFLTRRMFAPLGMSGTVAFVSGTNTVARRAFGHSRSDQGWTETDQSSTSAVLGDGGIYSSVFDLAKWDAHLEEPFLVSREKVAEAFRPWTRTNEEGVGYGYGWRIGQLDGRRMLFHTGETIGFRNALLRLPEARLFVVILTNRNEGKPLEAAKEIARGLQ